MALELTRRQRVRLALFLASGPALGSLAPALLWRDLGHTLVQVAAAVPSAAVVAVVFSALLRGQRVEARPEGLLVRRVAGRRLWLWHEIGQVTVRSGRLGRCVVVTGTHGGTASLTAPVDGPLLPDPEFDAKAAALVHWWQVQRGPWWRPPPPAFLTPAD